MGLGDRRMESETVGGDRPIDSMLGHDRGMTVRPNGSVQRRHRRLGRPWGKVVPLATDVSQTRFLQSKPRAKVGDRLSPGRASTTEHLPIEPLASIFSAPRSALSFAE